MGRGEPAGESRDGQVGSAPKKVHRAALADETRAECFENTVALQKHPPEAVGVLRVVGGVGFVLIPHLDPNHVSMLPELLKKYTEMAIVQAADGMKVEPNRVHVIPPNNAMTIAQGMLRLQLLKEPRSLRLPIDVFFTSLAADRGARAVGIILSGNGMDGTLGLEAIKARSGMAMAQEPATAEYDGMPRSAVETGLVNYVLAPEKMARQLVDYLTHGISRPPAIVEQVAEPLGKICQLLHARTGHDFSLYKKNTIGRRIERQIGRAHV